MKKMQYMTNSKLKSQFNEELDSMTAIRYTEQNYVAKLTTSCYIQLSPYWVKPSVGWCKLNGEGCWKLEPGGGKARRYHQRCYC